MFGNLHDKPGCGEADSWRAALTKQSKDGRVSGFKCTLDSTDAGTIHDRTKSNHANVVVLPSSLVRGISELSRGKLDSLCEDLVFEQDCDFNQESTTGSWDCPLYLIYSLLNLSIIVFSDAETRKYYCH